MASSWAWGHSHVVEECSSLTVTSCKLWTWNFPEKLRMSAWQCLRRSTHLLKCGSVVLLPSALARGSEWGIYSRNVRAYVRTYVSVTLRNVNLRYRLGMSIWGQRSECQFALTPRQDIAYVHYTTKLGRRFLPTDDGEDSATGPSQRTYLRSEVHKRVLNAADGCRLWEKKKQRSQPTVESQESDRRTRKSSKVESTYWRLFTSQVFRLTLHVTVVLYCSLSSH